MCIYINMLVHIHIPTSYATKQWSIYGEPTRAWPPHYFFAQCFELEDMIYINQW